MRLRVPGLVALIFLAAAGLPAAAAGEEAGGGASGIAARLAVFAHSADRVFHGVCTAAEVGWVEVAGARLQATTYTFEVIDPIQGITGPTVRFRQLGAGDGGPLDLGRRAGLPVYEPGQEYVLFLLPDSRSGLTSPAGSAEAAFAVDGSAVSQMVSAHGYRSGGPVSEPGAAGRGAAAAGPLRLPYEELRAAVLAGGESR